MKLQPKAHGIIDYLVVIFLFLAPSLFNLPHVTGIFTYALGGVHLLLTIITNFEFGLFKVLPFKIHGWIELIVSFALVGVGFYLGKEEGLLARDFYFCFAAAVFIVWAATDYGNKPRELV